MNPKQISIILVETQSDENLGAVARAMYNFGYDKLLLVSPKARIDSQVTLATAHGSESILKNARIYDDFETAVADQNILVTTTQRPRKKGEPFFYPVDLKKKISTLPEESKIAFVFGSEKTGLSNQQLLQSDFICTIPTIHPQPSLNLAQAVMILLYEFSILTHKASPYKWDFTDKKEIQFLKQNFEHVLTKSGFPASHTVRSFTDILFRSLRRAQLEKRDFTAWMKFLKHLEKRR